MSNRLTKSKYPIRIRTNQTE